MNVPDKVKERFWASVDVRGLHECWAWQRWRTKAGYGKLGWSTNGQRTTQFAHRVAWTIINGPIPGGMTIDHICRWPPCVNPIHLRLLTNVENARDNGAKRRTHCPQGHPYDEANTIWYKGHRYCRMCKLFYIRRWHHRQRILRSGGTTT